MTDRKKDRQTERQTNRKIDRQLNMKQDGLYMDRQGDRWIQTDKFVDAM